MLDGWRSDVTLEPSSYMSKHKVLGRVCAVRTSGKEPRTRFMDI
jgi:hypothetical protein